MHKVQETRIVPLVSDELLRQIIKKAQDAIRQQRNAEPERIIEFE